VLVSKSVHSAFHGRPELDEWLRAHDVDAVAICGITTNHCCETTARVGSDLGYRVTFVMDATATFDRRSPNGTWISADQLAESTFANLNEEFAEILDTAALLRLLTASAD
jgi:nicotinamidase-related amidase